jgi:hypothetical protein
MFLLVANVFSFFHPRRPTLRFDDAGKYCKGGPADPTPTESREYVVAFF